MTDHTFKQKTMVEQYLYARQELELNQDDEEVRATVVDLIKNLKEFMTDEEIAGLEQYIEPAPEEEKLMEVSFALPSGWDPEDFEVQVTDSLVNVGQQQFSITLFVSRKTPDGWTPGQ